MARNVVGDREGRRVQDWLLANKDQVLALKTFVRVRDEVAKHFDFPITVHNVKHHMHVVDLAFPDAKQTAEDYLEQRLAAIELRLYNLEQRP